MARCYHCGKILEDAWLKRQGAALMGKTTGEKKARTPQQARKAALARWGLKDDPPPPPEPPPKPRKRGKKKS